MDNMLLVLFGLQVIRDGVSYSTDCYSTVPLRTDTALRALMISYLRSFIETLFNLLD